MSINVTVIPANRLTDAQAAHWSRLQAADPNLQSPFFHPEFTRDAAAVFGNIEVAVLDEGGEPAGYFPFQRGPGNVGLPVGGVLNDFQGVIARPELLWDPIDLVRKCKLSGWRFTQLVAAQQPFQRYHWFTGDSHSSDLRGGFEEFCRERREAGSTLISRTKDKRRKAIRDLGPLRFEPYVTDPKVFDSLVAWKSEQYRRINTVNHLATPGTLDFLKRLCTRTDSDFQGMLSGLYFGDHLVAVHLGMRCRKVLHLWFPTYSEDYARFSPGVMYFIEQARVAEEIGVERIDMGRGQEQFKHSLRSFGTPVAEGAVGLGAVSNSMRRMWVHTRNWVRTSPFREPARAVVRKIRGLFLYGLQHDADTRQL